MTHENQESVHHGSNIFNVLLGVLVGGLAGAVTMLLMAPQSGEETRMHLKEKGIELRDRTTSMVEDALTKARSSADQLTMDGREKIKELKQQGQELAVEQLERVSEAAKAGKKAIQSS